MAATLMAQDILSGLQTRANFVLSLIDPNRTPPNAPVAKLDIQEGVRACLQIGVYLTDCLRLAWDDVLTGRVDDVNQTGHILLAGVSVVTKTFQAVHRALDAAIEHGLLNEVDSHFEEAIAKFRETSRTVEATHADLRKRWPWLDTARLRESKAAGRQGAPCRSTKEAFREVRLRIQEAGRGPADPLETA